ncbi:MAG TPA: HAD-IIA family hydrolase [Anaerolineaceae bacterium]|nr:HAD-IIA family hydrolase [Anaerolineaceae bacterium]
MIHSLRPPVCGLILDMDGVLWRSNQPIGNLENLFQNIKDSGLKVVLATNNATLSIEQYLAKLEGFGVRLEPWQIINSGQATAYRMSQDFPRGGPVYLVGENGIATALAERGFTLSDQDDIIAVVVGLDRRITYEKLKHATLAVRRGIPFYGTNPDVTFPAPEGLIPGAGSIIATVQTASSVTPVIAGKPFPAMFNLALERMGLKPGETLCVGDRLDTDIAGGQRVGCRTAVVLTGVTTHEEAQAWSPPPDLIAPDLTALIID